VAVVLVTLILAGLVALGLARSLRGDLSRVRYLSAANDETSLALGHLSFRWRNLVEDARILRLELESVAQACSEEVFGLSRGVIERLMKAHSETTQWIGHYLRVIESEPGPGSVMGMNLRQHVDLLASLSHRWALDGSRSSGPSLNEARQSIVQAIELLKHFEEESAFSAIPYR
jgi:hypothetical protein